MIQAWEVGQPVEDAFCIAVLMVDMDAGTGSRKVLCSEEEEDADLNAAYKRISQQKEDKRNESKFFSLQII